MLLRLLIPSCLCLLLTQTVASSSHYYQSYPSYSYYQPAQVYNNYQTIYQPYAVPLYSIGYAQPTAVISGSVAYQQAITTTATAGATTAIQSSVQGLLGAEVGMQQQQSQESKFDRLLAAVERLAGISGAQALQQQQPHIGILKQHCAACHTGGSAKGNLQMFDASGLFALQPNMTAAIIYRISTSDPKLRMPPNGSLQYDDHRRLIEGLMNQAQQQAEKLEQKSPLSPAEIPDTKKKEGPF